MVMSLGGVMFTALQAFPQEGQTSKRNLSFDCGGRLDGGAMFKSKVASLSFALVGAPVVMVVVVVIQSRLQN